MRREPLDTNDIHMPPGAAKLLARAGAERAVKHANETTPRWVELAEQVVIDFMRELPERGRFTTETVRHSRAGKQLSAPPDKRAWGGVMNRLAARGLCQSMGYVASVDPRGHRHPVTLWEKRNG